ncbi:MAG: hypothetical protein QXS37_00605 [Candidatus Aenigmatarchaeota archaeon]
MSVTKEEIKKGVEEILKVLYEEKFPYEKMEEEITLPRGEIQLRLNKVRYVVYDLGVVLEVSVDEEEKSSKIFLKFKKLLPNYKWFYKDRSGNIIQYKKIDSVEGWRIEKELKELYNLLNNLKN